MPRFSQPSPLALAKPTESSSAAGSELGLIDWSNWPGVKRALRHAIHQNSRGGTRRQATLPQLERGCQMRKSGRTTRMAPRWAPSGFFVERDRRPAWRVPPNLSSPPIPATPPARQSNTAARALTPTSLGGVRASTPAADAPQRRPRRRSKVQFIYPGEASDTEKRPSARIPRTRLGGMPNSPFSPNPWKSSAAPPAHGPSALLLLGRATRRAELSVFDDPDAYLWSQADQQQVVNVLNLLLNCGLAHNSGPSR
mgnify:CR=1 FL=1